MKKAWKHTLFALLSAVVCVFGSMAGMRMILAAREHTLLSEKGNAIVQPPIQVWQEAQKNNHQEEIETEGQKETEESKEGIQQTLELWEMEQALFEWNLRSYEVSHTPLMGQISMEEAVEKGRDWLETMEFGKSVKSEENGKDNILHSLSASLCVGNTAYVGNKPLLPYYSFWNIWLSSEQMTASLRLNAVTGEVWEATLIWYGEVTDELPILFGEQLEQFAQLAGVEPLDGPLMDLDGEDCYAFLRLQNTNMYARMESHIIESRMVSDNIGMIQKGIMATYTMVIN